MSESNERNVDRMIADGFSPLRADEDWEPDLQRGFAILHGRRMAKAGTRRRGATMAIATAAGCIAIAVFPMSRALAGHLVSECVQETAAVREFLLGRRAGSNGNATYVTHADRRMAPDFTLIDASGNRVRLADSRGKVVLLNFWATWCTPCEQEIPWFVEFQQRDRERGLAVLGVAMDEGGWASIKPYIERKKVNYPVMLGDDDVAGLFGGNYFPMPLTIIVDRSGRIAAIHAGLCSKDEYESDINRVLEER